MSSTLSLCLCPAAETAVSLCWCGQGVENKNLLALLSVCLPFDWGAHRVLLNPLKTDILRQLLLFTYAMKQWKLKILKCCCHARRNALKVEWMYLTRAMVAFPETHQGCFTGNFCILKPVGWLRVSSPSFHKTIISSSQTCLYVSWPLTP